MSDVESDAFTALAALYTADTGAGGLAQASGSARAQAFLRFRSNKQVPGTPHIICEIEPRRADAQGKNSYDLNITMTVVDLFNKAAFTQEDAVIARMATVFDGVEPAASASWNFCTLSRVGESPTGRRGDYRQKRILYHMTATAV